MILINTDCNNNLIKESDHAGVKNFVYISAAEMKNPLFFLKK